MAKTMWICWSSLALLLFFLPTALPASPFDGKWKHIGSPLSFSLKVTGSTKLLFFFNERLPSKTYIFGEQNEDGFWTSLERNGTLIRFYKDDFEKNVVVEDGMLMFRYPGQNHTDCFERVDQLKSFGIWNLSKTAVTDKLWSLSRWVFGKN